MADEGFKRKLTAILSADVEGYSRLMDDDEEATVRTLTAYRTAIADLVQQFRGRIVDTPGDNIMAEFISVVDSVNCAVEIQRELAERNAELPDNRKMQFRIGVNLGDVIDEDGRIYGDGVNIAARVESLAEAGGICISGRTHDQVENKLGLEYEDLGKHEVKNISRPIQVYRVLSFPGAAAHRVVKAKQTLGRRWLKIGLSAAVVVVVVAALGIWQFYIRRPAVEPASVEKMAFPLPDKPSIAVLPFDNLSKDREQEYFADGMTDDLITDLSKISGLFVIARNSTFQYKDKAVDIKKVSRELGIRYVLEGSVRKVGNKVRINAQLIDATSGGHLWADRYDGQMEDIFSLQDKITQKIVSALAVRLTPGEKENIASKGTENIAAYDAFLKGWQHYLQGTPDALSAAVNDFKKAIELDPAYSQAYSALALTFEIGSAGGKKFVEALGADYFSARVIARHYLNIAMKNPTALAYRVASRMDLRLRRHDEALQNAGKAIAIYPNDAEMQLNIARVLTYSGRPKEAMNVIKKVMQLDPNRMADCLYLLGIAYFCTKQYEEAISVFKRVRKYTSTHWTEEWLAIVYAHLGRVKEAKAEFEKYSERWLGAVEGDQSITKLDLQPTVYNNPFKEPEAIKRFVEGLIKAGHPEPHRYYVAYKKNMLSGDEIRDLVFGRTETSPIFAGGTWTVKFERDGNALFDGYGFKDKGKWWVEGNQLCQKWKQMMGAGLTVYNDLYRNPSGTLEGKDQNLKVTDFGMLPVSYVD